MNYDCMISQWILFDYCVVNVLFKSLNTLKYVVRYVKYVYCIRTSNLQFLLNNVMYVIEKSIKILFNNKCFFCVSILILIFHNNILPKACSL